VSLAAHSELGSGGTGTAGERRFTAHACLCTNSLRTHVGGGGGDRGGNGGGRTKRGRMGREGGARAEARLFKHGMGPCCAKGDSEKSAEPEAHPSCGTLARKADSTPTPRPKLQNEVAGRAQNWKPFLHGFSARVVKTACAASARSWQPAAWVWQGANPQTSQHVLDKSALGTISWEAALTLKTLGANKKPFCRLFPTRQLHPRSHFEDHVWLHFLALGRHSCTREAHS
jgi:hypothetical protein